MLLESISLALVLCSPLVGAILLLVLRLFAKVKSERVHARIATTSLFLGFLGAIGLSLAHLAFGAPDVPRVLPGPAIGGEAYDLLVRADLPGVVVLLLGTGSTWLLTRFAVTYLHGDPGFVRYFALSCVLAFGLSIVALADDLGFLFLGWELVGLSSFLLVAFFHQRAGPVRSSLRVFAYYRIGDAGLAVALAAMHAAVGTGAFEHVFVPGALPPEVAMIAVFGIMIAAAVKSAQLPFSAWLPAALEGPTTSSALFYGGVVTHLGALLLMRAAPLFGPGASAVVVIMGLSTAVAASVTARAQADVKSARAYGGLVHISLVIAEIGAGWITLALLHITANVLWRISRLLWAPDVIGETRRLRARQDLPMYEAEGNKARSRWGARVWVFACERMHLDTMADRLVVAPLLAVGRLADHWERRLFSDETEPRRPEPAEQALAAQAAEASLSMLSSSGVVQR